MNKIKQDLDKEKEFLKSLVNDGIVDQIIFVDADGDIEEVYKKKFDS